MCNGLELLCYYDFELPLYIVKMCVSIYVLFDILISLVGWVKKIVENVNFKILG